jgi:hypothetical protein
MSRMFLIVLAAVVVVAAIVGLVVGAFPPTPAEHHVEHTVPNDQFKSP